MSIFGFGKRSRSRRSRRVNRRRNRRSNRRRSRRSNLRRHSRKGSLAHWKSFAHSKSFAVHMTIGNKIYFIKNNKTKVFKIKKNKDGRRYYVSGKRKHFLDSKVHRRSHRRSFGYMKNTLLNYMGNFQPSAKMSLAQSTTGMSAPQMIGHMNQVPLSSRSNFYTNIV